jgi:hypothetical protein
MQNLDYYTSTISKIFLEEKDRNAAHKKAEPVLVEMTKHKEVLFDIYRKNLLKPDFIGKVRHYPTIAFEIYLDDNIGMNANVFMPLPDKTSELSFQSIHHHGKLLLTTAAAEGPGYECILFKKGFTIDHQTKEANLEIEKQYIFTKGSTDFVGSYQPHVVFFPSDVSITYTVWAYEQTVSTVQGLKNNFIVKKFKEPIRKILKILGLSKTAGINVVENFDFYPEENKIKVLKNRIEFEHGDNENFLTNVFYVMQKTGFNDTAFLHNLKILHPQNKYLPILIDQLIANTPIANPFYDFHKNVQYVNLKKKEILNAFEVKTN